MHLDVKIIFDAVSTYTNYVSQLYIPVTWTWVGLHIFIKPWMNLNTCKKDRSWETCFRSTLWMFNQVETHLSTHKFLHPNTSNCTLALTSRVTSMITLSILRSLNGRYFIAPPNLHVRDQPITSPSSLDKLPKPFLSVLVCVKRCEAC